MTGHKVFATPAFYLLQDTVEDLPVTHESTSIDTKRPPHDGYTRGQYRLSK